MSINRRDFVRVSVATSMAWAAPAVIGAERNANHRVALIGTGWWGMNILGEAIRAGNCKVVGMCDVDRNQLDPAVVKVTELTGDAPKKFDDYRELLDQVKPDIAIVATPDHWHPLVTIAAVQSGAHVYVEKPIGHTVYEGRAMVQAARDNGRMVQVGTHRRVSPHNVSGIKFLKEGRAGKIGAVRALESLRLLAIANLNLSVWVYGEAPSALKVILFSAALNAVIFLKSTSLDERHT